MVLNVYLNDIIDFWELCKQAKGSGENYKDLVFNKSVFIRSLIF